MNWIRTLLSTASGKQKSSPFKIPKPGPLPDTLELRKPSSHWVPGACRPGAMREGSFYAAGVSRPLSQLADWKDPTADLAWSQYLHSFYDLMRADYNDYQDLHASQIQQWMEVSQELPHSAWSLDVTARRVTNWIRWSFRGGVLPKDALGSLCQQAQFLSGRLRRADGQESALAKALVFCGLFLNCDTSSVWVRQGVGVWNSLLKEAQTSDRVLVEKGPAGLAALCEDLLDLLNLVNAYRDDFQHAAEFTSTGHEKLQQLLLHLRLCTHPDGEIAFFRGSCLGVAPRLAVLQDYCRRLGQEPPERSEAKVVRIGGSNVIRFRGEDSLLLFNAASTDSRVPEYADLLSLEFSLLSQRILVNQGCIGVGDNAGIRSGVILNQHEELSTSVSQPSRVHIRDLQLDTTGAQLSAQAVHDAFRSYPGHPLVSRQMILNEKELRIHDRILGGFKNACVVFLLHPDLEVSFNPENLFGQIRLPNGKRAGWTVSRGRQKIVDYDWHPSAGVSRTGKGLVIQFANAEAELAISW